MTGPGPDSAVALARADALLALAMADATLVDLVDEVVRLAGELVPASQVSFVATPEAPLGATDIQVRDDNGEEIGALRCVPGDLSPEEQRFVGRLAEVLGTSLTRSRRQRELLQNEQRLIEAQRISKVGSYDFEIASNTNTWSDQLYRIYGREPQSFNATYEIFLSMLHEDDREHVMAVHQHSLATLEPFEMEERVVWPDGQVRTLASWGEVVADDQGNPLRMVGICWDITERRAIEQQLVHDTLHDRLTGLPNRTLLMDRLSQGIAALPRHGGSLGVVFLDVDRFKVINDGLGHEVGDAVLVALAGRLESLLRPGDTLARFGGDEFVVLCESLRHPAEAQQIAMTLLAGVEQQPLSVAGADVVLSMSAGIALATDVTDQATDLLRDADAAMYRAKRDARSQPVLFAADMREEALGRLETELELRRALGTHDLRLHYQPVVDLETSEIVGVEALLRWFHPTRGLVAPGDVIPIAEETGLIVPVGAWVLDQACRQLVAWNAELPTPLTMAVNLSGVEMVRPDFVETVAATLARTGVNPAYLTLEITETVLMRDAGESLEVLEALKALGVGLSVDDFGTGYSSLSYLKRFPVDVLKIDRSFVDGLGHDPDDLAIVQAIVALAGSLGMKAIAEGVEEPAHLEVLRGLGCALGQGYLLGRPVDPETLFAKLRVPGVGNPAVVSS